MELHRNDNQSEHVLTASGTIGVADLPELRTRLLEAIDGGDFDLLLDARHVSAFDDAALPALTAGRSRAEHLRRHLVVLDGEGGPVSASLRRSGLRLRFPVYPDASAAREGLAAQRADLAARNVAGATRREGKEAGLGGTLHMDEQRGEDEPSFAAGTSSRRAPPVTWELSGLLPMPASVAAARRQAHDVLDIWCRRGHLREDDALLLLDELAANAVRHAQTPFTMTLSLNSDVLRGGVLDDNPRPPVLRTPTLEDLGGRGIHLVSVLADQWGVDQHDGDGKTVWFEIDAKP